MVALTGDEQRVFRVHLRGAEHVKKLRALALGERGKLRYRVRRGAHVLLFRVEVGKHAVFKAHYLVAYAAPRQLAVQPVQVDKGVLAHGVGNESVVHLSGEALEICFAGDEARNRLARKAHIREDEQRHRRRQQHRRGAQGDS